MESIKKYHSLVIFLIYTTVVNLKSTPSFVDAIVLAILAGYIGVEAYTQYNSQPDIQADLEAKMRLMEIQINEQMKSTIFNLERDIKKLDTEGKELKTKIASFNSLKSVGMNSTVRF